MKALSLPAGRRRRSGRRWSDRRRGRHRPPLSPGRFRPDDGEADLSWRRPAGPRCRWPDGDVLDARLQAGCPRCPVPRRPGSPGGLAFQARACSRPPLPMISTFIVSLASVGVTGAAVATCQWKGSGVSLRGNAAIGGPWASVTEMAHVGEHHAHAVFVGGVDHFLVAHRATWLDDAGDARLAAASMPSRNGKKASEAMTEPATVSPSSAALMPAILAE